MEDLDQGGLATALERARRLEALYGAKLKDALKKGNEAEEELYPAGVRNTLGFIN